MSIIYQEEGYKINGACFEVYKEKGCGFLEDVYQECLEIEFELQGIPVEAQSPRSFPTKAAPFVKNISLILFALGKSSSKSRRSKKSPMSIGHRFKTILKQPATSSA